MKENREFDILENADDSEVELLAEVPVLTEKEKKRMKKMSRDKLSRKLGESEMGDEVSGVEQYKRPKWYSFAAVAACLVLICGIVGTTVFLGKRGKPPIAEPSVSELPTSEPTTETEFSMEATIEELIEKLNESSLVVYGGGVEVDKSEPVYYTIMGEEREYYRVTDERFSSVSDVMDYWKQYLAEPDYSIFRSYLSDGEWSLFKEDIESGGLYFEHHDEAEECASHTELKKDSDGKVHFDIKPTEDKDILYYFEDSRDFSVPAVSNGEEFTLCGRVVLDDGKWKLSWLCDEEGLNDEDTLQYLGIDRTAAFIVLSKLEEYEVISMGSGVVVDENEAKELQAEDGSGHKYDATYYRVTDRRFNDLSDVKAYFGEAFSERFLGEDNCLWEGGLPRFKEDGGVLYYLLAGIETSLEFKGFDDYEIHPDGTMLISLLDAPSVNNAPIPNVLKVICVKENGRWKIDSYQYCKPDD